MHAIIGAGGTVSPDLTKVLMANHVPVRQVARTARNYEYGTALSADLMNPADALKAVDGCEVAYLTVGLPYKTTVWEAQWRALMKNVVDACIQTRTKLVFIDNIYMISDESIPHITETSPMEPSSKKGKIRADVDHILLNAVNEGKLDGIIARSADFYGVMPPKKSLLLDLVIAKMVAGSSPQWFYTVDKKHSFTYMPDIAKALYLLATDASAGNQVWNLPTAPAMTLAEIIALTNKILGSNKKPQVMGEFMMTLLRLAIPAVNEMKELKNQVIMDYWLDSSKFENHFNVKPASMEQGISDVVGKLRVGS